MSTQRDGRGWLALGSILLGLVCIVIGFGILTWTPRAASAAVATVAPTSQQTAGLPTISSATPTVAPTDTPLPPPTAPKPTYSIPADTSLQLTIVHSNDTWGYTQPCG